MQKVVAPAAFYAILSVDPFSFVCFVPFLLSVVERHGYAADFVLDCIIRSSQMFGKSVFPNDDALLKMLCRAQVNITKSGQVRLAAGTLYGAIEILLMKKMDTVFVPGRFEK